MIRSLRRSGRGRWLCRDALCFFSRKGISWCASHPFLSDVADGREGGPQSGRLIISAETPADIHSGLPMGTGWCCSGKSGLNMRFFPVSDG